MTASMIVTSRLCESLYNLYISQGLQAGTKVVELYMYTLFAVQRKRSTAVCTTTSTVFA